MTPSIANALSPMLRFTKSVNVVVITFYKDYVVNDSGRGIHFSPGQEAPHYTPSPCIESIDVVINASDVDNVVGD